MQGEYFALEGISELLDTIERIRGAFNPALAVEGVVLTMFDDRTNLAQQVRNELKNYFGEKLCATTVPRNIRLAEAPSHGKAALVYDPRSKGAESYIKLAKELIERQGAGMGMAGVGPQTSDLETQTPQALTTEAKEEHGEKTVLEEVPAAPEMDKTA